MEVLTCSRSPLNLKVSFKKSIIVLHIVKLVLIVLAGLGQKDKVDFLELGVDKMDFGRCSQNYFCRALFVFCGPIC